MRIRIPMVSPDLSNWEAPKKRQTIVMKVIRTTEDAFLVIDGWDNETYHYPKDMVSEGDIILEEGDEYGTV